MPSLRENLCSQSGAVTVEYMLMLAFIAIPSIWLLRLLLDVLTAHYQMVTFLETLPYP